MRRTLWASCLAFLALTPARADFLYTLTEHAVPNMMPQGIAQFETQLPISAPDSPWPPPPNEPYPVPGALYIPASSDTICGGSYYTCTQPHDGTYWWNWPGLGIEVMFVGETAYNGTEETAEFLANFGDINLSTVGTYTAPGGIQLVIDDPVGAPEPGNVWLVMIGIGLGFVLLKSSYILRTAKASLLSKK